MKQGLTTILYVLDRSGSMGTVWHDTVPAFDRFLAEQKALPGEAEFGLTYFDNEISIGEITALQQAKSLSEQSHIVPRGYTALLDAVGRTVTQAGIAFAKRPEDQRPERVLLVIQTDGQENSSTEYTGEQVKKLIEHQKDAYGWQVIFLGADQNAWNSAQLFAANASLSFNNRDQHIASAYVSSNVTSYRTTGSLHDQGSTDVRAVPAN